MQDGSGQATLTFGVDPDEGIFLTFFEKGAICKKSLFLSPIPTSSNNDALGLLDSFLKVGSKTGTFNTVRYDKLKLCLSSHGWNRSIKFDTRLSWTD